MWCRQAVGLFECLSAVVTMFQSFTFEICHEHHPGGEVEYMFSISQQPKNGLWLRARRRAL